MGAERPLHRKWHSIETVCIHDPDTRARVTGARGEGWVHNPELEVGQLVLLGLVGLVIVQGQGLVFMRETLKHPNVHKVIVFNLNLRRERRVRGGRCCLGPPVAVPGGPCGKGPKSPEAKSPRGISN